MAASMRVSGYQCQFISQVSEELFCGTCKLVAREPHISSCCGEHFCKNCITQVLDASKPCPICSEAEFTSFLDKRIHKKILSLQAHCTMKERGCEWVGKLEDLQAHLLVDTNDCQYVDIQCPDKCGESVPRHQLPSHLVDSCLNRDHFCKYCNFSSTYHVIVYEHWPKCLHYPVQCPNACSMGAVERRDLEDHIKVCLLQEVSCELSHAGCKETFLREYKDRHMEENTQKHLLLMLAMSQRMCQEFEQKLRTAKEERAEEFVQAKQEREEEIRKTNQGFEQKLQAAKEQREKEIVQAKQEREEEIRKTKQEIEKKLQTAREEIVEVMQEKDDQIREKNDQIRVLEEKREQDVKALRDEKNKQISKLQAEVETLKCQLEMKGILQSQHFPYRTTPPVFFTLNDFEKLKTSRQPWTGPDLYTHKGGYKISFMVYFHNTRLVVVPHANPGEFDDHLKWPANATITLEVINQCRDGDHITYTKQCQWTKPTGSYQISEWYLSIDYTDLPMNEHKQTQYLNNCLVFRLTKVSEQ